MLPFLTHQQFEFSPRQRELVLQLAMRAQEHTIQSQATLAQDESDTSRLPQGARTLLQHELAKFSYNLGEEQYLKISISTPVLMLLLFEIMNLLGPVREVPLPGREVQEQEWLRLHYVLSSGYLEHYTNQEFVAFIDQFLSPEVIARRERFPHHYINTAGMDEVAVFTALYNAAKPQGRSFHQDEVRDITVEEGARLMHEAEQAHDPADRDYIQYDYVNGRRMKISRQDILAGYIDVTNYDMGNGAGTAQRAVEHLPRI